MRLCLKCKTAIPNSITIEGKKRNIQHRKYCLTCSPFGRHNTRVILDNDLTCLDCGASLTGNQTKYCSRGCKSKNLTNNTNDYAKQVIRYEHRKKYFIAYLGGVCEGCGYCRNYASLVFHHKDRTQKLFEINGRMLSNCKMDKLREEVDKCSLFCTNCHGEFHYPQCSLVLPEGLEPPTPEL